MNRDTRKQARRSPAAVRAESNRRSSGQQLHASLEDGEITAGLDVLLEETNGFDADAVVLADDLRRIHLLSFT